MKPPRVVKTRATKSQRKQRWALMDDENGWQIIIPDIDIKPHATLIVIDPKGNKNGDVAGWDCPCKPMVEWKDKIIVHNSFEEMVEYIKVLDMK